MPDQDSGELPNEIEGPGASKCDGGGEAHVFAGGIADDVLDGVFEGEHLGVAGRQDMWVVAQVEEPAKALAQQGVVAGAARKGHQCRDSVAITVGGTAAQSLVVHKASSTQGLSA